MEFDPKHGLIPNGHHQAVRFPAKEAGDRATNDPREFYEFSRGYPYGLWAHVEANARRLRGQLGEEQLKEAAERLTISQAEGPGGRWYWEQTRTGFGTKDTYITYIWSPQVGYNPVVRFSSWEKPDGGLSDRTEWQWRPVADAFVPEIVNSVAYQEDGTLDNQRHATLEDSVVNKPLDPHQFDYEGLGLKDGDVINDDGERVQYVLKDGKPVQQGNSGR